MLHGYMDMESPLQDEFHEELHSQHFDTLGMSSFIFILAVHVHAPQIVSICIQHCATQVYASANI